MNDYLLQDLPLFRSTDPETSRQVKPIRIGSHRAILLAIYADVFSQLGLTDEEAGARAAARGHDIKGYWKRCSDLRNMGLIADGGTRRTVSSGSQAIVCFITPLGEEIVEGWA
jgi:hypothetical protein